MSDVIVTGVYWRKDPVLMVSPDGRGWEEFKPTIWSPPPAIGRAVTDPVREVLWESKWTGPALQAAMSPKRFAEEYEQKTYPVDPQFFENVRRGLVERAYRSLPRRARELVGELTTGPVDRRQFEESLELYGRYLERGAMLDAIDANAFAFANRELGLPSHQERWRRVRVQRVNQGDPYVAELPMRSVRRDRSVVDPFVEAV